MDNPISAALQSLQDTAQNAAKPEHSEPGPGDVGPTTETKPEKSKLITLEMSEEEVGEWWKRYERAKARVTTREEKWDILLNEYLPVISKSGEAETVKVQAHFRNVHSKIGQLFYKEPDLVLSPDDPSPAQNQRPNPMNPAQMMTMEEVIVVKQAVLNKKLGRDGVKMGRLMDEVLFDVLAWSGVGSAKLGYRCVTKPYDKPVMVSDPSYQPNPMASQSLLGLGAPPAAPPMVPQIDPLTGKPKTERIDVPIYEEWYCRRISPKKVLWNDDLRSSRIDEDATWKGMDFFMSPRAAMKAFKLTEEEANKAAEDDRVHEYDEDKQGSTNAPGLVHGVEIWCKASVFTDEVHPQAINQLVLIEGIRDRPVVWRPSPDQDFDEMGRLTDNSLIGFPIRTLTIRDLADSPFPPSDSAFTNSEIKQMSTWRRQSIKLRDAQIGKYLYDSGAFDKNDIERLKNDEVGEWIPIGEGRAEKGFDKIIGVTPQVKATADDYRGAELIKQDMQETLGISSIQSGVPESTVRTATEIRDVGAAVAGRNEKERNRAVDFYLDCVRAYDQLLMRYADENEYVQITGEDGARRMQMWNGEMISGPYLYDIAPDSQMSPDNAVNYQQDMNMYNLAAHDPLFNRAYFLRRMARRRGMDPMKLVIDPSQLPKPSPPPPHLTISVKGEDLLNPLVTAPLVAMGLLPDPSGAPGATGSQPQGRAAQPPHGGAAQKGEALSQHMDSNSGGAQNSGQANHRASQVK